MEPGPGPAELGKYSFDLAVEIWPLALKDIHNRTREKYGYSTHY